MIKQRMDKGEKVFKNKVFSSCLSVVCVVGWQKEQCGLPLFNECYHSVCCSRVFETEDVFVSNTRCFSFVGKLL